jgi:hypothetical protein
MNAHQPQKLGAPGPSLLGTGDTSTAGRPIETETKS